MAACQPQDPAHANSPAVKDAHSFPFSGSMLTVNADETSVHIVSGSAGRVVVSRVRHGSAADSGNSRLAMHGGTLDLGVTCEGLVTSCDSKITVSVPPGVGLQIVASGSPITMSGLTGAVDARVTNDGSLSVDGSSGNLHLRCGGGNIVVQQARSARVWARATADGNVNLGFARPPREVDAYASGSLRVTLPAGFTYRVVGPSVSGNVPSDSSSQRVSSVTANDGTAVVDQAG